MENPKSEGFAQSRTYENLQRAYLCELQASTKYRIYSQLARGEGYQQIANIFEETGGNEEAHARIWLRFLNEGNMPDTFVNLQDAYRGEKEEWTHMYKKYAATARKEGYEDLARLFEGVAGIERHHDYRYERLAENIEKKEVFCQKGAKAWICLNCGYIHWGVCGPEKCPVCKYPQGFYQGNCENY